MTPEGRPRGATFDKLAYLQADFDNYRKRMMREQAEIAKRAEARMLEKLLPVLDNFERALDHEPEGSSLGILQRELIDSLKSEGLQEIEALGTEFDPRFHEAVESHEDARGLRADGDIGASPWIHARREGASSRDGRRRSARGHSRRGGLGVTMSQRDWLEKDFYKVLGVPDTASKDEIKRAYRKLAQKHHPDTNKNDTEAEHRFKEVSEAYSILSNEDKRKEYDEIRKYADAGGSPFGFRPGHPARWPWGQRQRRGSLRSRWR